MRFFVAKLARLACMAVLIGNSLAWAQDDEGETKDPPSIAAELPKDYDGLAQLKSELISEYQQHENAGDKPAAIETLNRLLPVEEALMQMAELELGDLRIELVDSYRATYQDDASLLASEYYNTGDYDSAAKWYNAALNTARKRADFDLVAFSDVLAFRDRAAKLATATAEEIAQYDEAVQQNNRARTLADQADWEEAISLQEQSLATQERLAGMTPYLAGEFSRMASWLREAGEQERAEQAFLAAKNGFNQTVGKENDRYATTLYNYALLLQAMGRQQDAAAVLEETRMIENRIGVDYESQLMTLNELAGIYRSLNDDTRFDAIVGAYRYLEARSDLGLEKLANYIPVDAYLAASMGPAAIMRDPSLDYLPREVVTAWSLEELGFDPSLIETVVLYLTLPIDSREPHGALLVKTLANQAWEPRLPGEAETVEYRDMTYVRRNTPGQPLCHAELAEGIYVIGEELGVRQALAMAAARKARDLPIGKLGDQLVATHVSVGVSLAVDLDRLRAFADAMIRETPPFPGDLEKLKSVAQQVDVLTFSLAIDYSPQAQLNLVPRADATAEDIAAQLTAAMQFGATLLADQMDVAMAEESSSVATALQQYVARLTDARLNDLLPTIENGEVVIRIDGSQDIQGPILVGLLLPAIQAAREAAQRMDEQNQLKQLGLGFYNYESTFGAFPPRFSTLEDGTPALSWRVHMLPFVGEQDLYKEFHLDEPWNSEHNLSLLKRMPTVYADANVVTKPGMTNILALAGEGLMLDAHDPVKLSRVLDGLSNTILLVEANADQAVPWTKPADLPFDAEQPLEGVGSARPRGFSVLYADGSVRFFSSDINPDSFAAQATRDDGKYE